MIKLETAVALRDAGLVPDLECGDKLYGVKGELFLLHPYNIDEDEDIFAPRIDQLLAEIEGRGWKYYAGCNSTAEGKYVINIWRKDSNNYRNPIEGHKFYADSPEEAAATALLWILREGK